MNKVFCRKRWIFSFLLTGYLILFNTSCGLDTLYVIDAPTNTVHVPEFENTDEIYSYFDFYTVDHHYDSIKFKGTEVYYKIYSSAKKLESERDSLNSLSTRDDSSSAANRLVETYKFQPLRGKNYYGTDVLIPSVESNQRVRIRLSDYAGTYFAEITVDGKNIYDSSSRVIPVRNLSSNTKPSFNFNSLSAKDLPKSGDVDYEPNGSEPSETDYYVSMFAVAVGFDTSYSPVYSNILFLGSVHIPK